MIIFFDDKDSDMLKLGCTLPNPASICLDKPTYTNFYPFTISLERLLEKIREGFVGGPSITFTRKTFVEETFKMR